MKRIFLLNFLIGLCFYIPAKANDYPVTVRGRVFGCDWSGSTFKKFPLWGAKVELVDSDADGSQLFDDVIGTAIVKEDGTFEVSGAGGDPGDYSWSKPDIYVRFVFNYYDKVRLTDELNNTRYASTPEHEHDNFEGVLDIGTWTLENGISAGESTEASVWFNVCRAWDDYVRITGEEPKPGYCDVEYWSAIYSGTPWTNDNTIHWPVHYPSGSAKHEFAHLIRHSFDGDRDHFNWDVTRFRYARYHSQCAEGCGNWSTESREMNEAYAFNEGWAEFWANEFYCDMNFSSQCEGGVAHLLKDMEESLRQTMAQPRAFMCRVLKNNPGSIHSIGDFISKVNELAGQTLYAARIEKTVRTKILSSYVNTRIPPAVMSTYQAKNLGNINAAITLVDGKIAQRRGKIKMLPCQGAICNTGTDNIVTASGLNAQRSLLVLQQDIMQEQAGLSADELDMKRTGNNFDSYMNLLRTKYSNRISELIDLAFNDAIGKLQNNGSPDAYSMAVMAHLQSKRPLPAGADRGKKRKISTRYSFYLPVSISRDAP